jgi:hypothetical protein
VTAPAWAAVELAATARPAINRAIFFMVIGPALADAWTDASRFPCIEPPTGRGHSAFFVASGRVPDLLIRAKLLFVAAKLCVMGWGRPVKEQSPIRGPGR